jgi:CBS-domain-containing membrane protein
MRGWIRSRRGLAWQVFAGCALAIGVAGALALASGLPWLFPSLGPTAMLQTEEPGSASSSPRNTLVGHGVALLAGYLCLLVFGLSSAGSVLDTGVDASRIGATAISLAVTAGALVLLRCPHPPAGATTLIVSLGFLRTPEDLAIALASVCVLTAVCWIYNRLLGTPMPVWVQRRAGEAEPNQETGSTPGP